MSMRKAHGLRLQTSIVQDNVPVEVAAGLFIGSIHAAFNAEALKSNKISHVLNLAGSYATFPEDFTYLSLSIRDKEYASLLSCLPIAAVFIDAGLKHGGVLIHCAGGRSRSPAVAMAFVMMKQQMSYSAISAQVKAQRPVVSLNVGFEAQLKCLEFAGGDVFVANQHLLKARLTRLAQQHEDGELASEVAKKRRQSQQASSQSPPPPLLKKQSSIEMLALGRKSGPPVLTKPHIGAEGSLKDEEEECGVGFQTLQPTRRPATEESNRTGSATLSPSKANGDTKKKAGSALWRSLTSFKSSKRVAKATIEGNIQNRTGVLELQKPGVSSFASEDNKAAAVGQMPAHLVFLRRNAAEWQRCVQQLVGIDKDVASESSGGSIIAQVSALIDEDSTVLVALNDCKQWFVDPQLWTIDQAKTNPEGEIHCPREACGAIVGDWRWEGLRYACGGSVAPAFVMKRDAVCVLGNMTSQSAELMAAASSDTHPEK
ncbi:hypothetical protein PRIC2_006129 [Phytophthora ramorum]